MRAKVYVTPKPGMLDPAGQGDRALAPFARLRRGARRAVGAATSSSHRRRRRPGDGAVRRHVPQAARQWRDRGLPVRARRLMRRAAMRWGVVTFPGSLDDHDAVSRSSRCSARARVRCGTRIARCTGVDCVVLPGGFSYGDYLRCGAMARFSPVMESVVRFARDGGLVLGHLQRLPDPLRGRAAAGRAGRNRGLSFVCARHVRVEETATPFTRALPPGRGAAPADQARRGLLRRRCRHARRSWRTTARSCCATSTRPGRATAEANPNGSLRNIAGIVNARAQRLRPDAASRARRRAGCSAARTGAGFFRSVRATCRRACRRAPLGAARA